MSKCRYVIIWLDWGFFGLAVAAQLNAVDKDTHVNHLAVVCRRIVHLIGWQALHEHSHAFLEIGYYTGIRSIKTARIPCSNVCIVARPPNLLGASYSKSGESTAVVLLNLAIFAEVADNLNLLHNN